jgi:ribosomal 30S subunit maturation factor RimM
VRGGPRFVDPAAHPLKIVMQSPIDALVIQNHLRRIVARGTEMKSTFKGLLIAAILTALPLAGAMAAAPTKDEVVTVVKKAVEFYKTNGREKALVEFNKKDGQFAKGEDYVDVHDLNGVCVAHPVSPAKVGLNRMDQSDSAGKFYVKDLVDAAKQKPSGWIEYVMKNPTTGKLENKTAYWEMHDGLIFKAGTYTE